MERATEYDIDENFEALEGLSDGTEVLIRLLQPGDRHLLEEGFAQLSSRSRYQRFLSAKPSLSAGEVEYLVDIDNEDHLAIGAVIEEKDGGQQGLGVARYVRYEDEPQAAEVAVTVIDAYQGKGLGRLLLEYLVCAARERGLSTLRADCLATNVPIRRLFEQIGPVDVLERNGPVISLKIALVDNPCAGDKWRPGHTAH